MAITAVDFPKSGYRTCAVSARNALPAGYPESAATNGGAILTVHFTSPVPTLPARLM